MAPRKPFIPAAARHDRVARPARIAVRKAIRDLVADALRADDATKRDGKQGALDGIPNLALGSVIDVRTIFDGDGGGPPKKDTDKSTDKQNKEDKEGKESKDNDEKGKDAKDADESGKIGGSENVEFGLLRYGRPEVLDARQLGAAVNAHAARGLVKGPMI